MKPDWRYLHLPKFPKQILKKKKLLAQQKIFQEALHAPQGDSELKNVVNILVQALKEDTILVL